MQPKMVFTTATGRRYHTRACWGLTAWEEADQHDGPVILGPLTTAITRGLSKCWYCIQHERTGA